MTRNLTATSRAAPNGCSAPKYSRLPSVSIDMLSNEVTWSDQEETFDFVTATFDVTEAKEIIRTSKPRKIVEMDIEGVADLVGMPGKMTIGIHVDWNKVQSDQVDMSIPIVLVHFRDSFMPIDGWHRIAKAKLEGRARLPCVVLNKRESKQVTTRNR